MARISELHYSNAYAASSGVSEFLEIALSPGEDPADFTVSFYQNDGSVGFEVTLDDPDIQVSVDPDNGEFVYVISADDFPILLTDPNGNGSDNYEAYALTDTSGSPGTVIDYYDIGGGTQNILALDGAAAGATSVNLPVLVGPNSTTTTLQFNQPDPDTLTYGTVGDGDTGLACFVAGTRIDTECGPRMVEALKAGDMVRTRDAGLQPIRWIGSASVSGLGRNAPVVFSPGALGATETVAVSPQHRILVAGWQSELLFGDRQVLVPAKALVNGSTVRRAPVPHVRYFHILLDDHHILTSSGLASESFFPACDDAGAVAAFDEAQALIPALRSVAARHLAARRCLSVSEGRMLRAI